MPIPALGRDGLLPVGVHECRLAELKNRFGGFQVSDRRPMLFAKLEAFILAARASEIVRHVIVDGSFVTSSAASNDIDVIVVVDPGHDFAADLGHNAYAVLSKRRVRQIYGLDILVAREGSIEYRRWTDFFQQVRLEPGRQKGILRLIL